MIIKNAEFIISSPDVKKCPKPKFPEYAFIGRSNVGKSSLINMLVDIKNLAKISGTPGKTQLINYFEINHQWFLVDLPGYGFAKISKSIREKFEKMINDFLIKRPNLLNTFVLIDARLEPQANDTKFITWCGANGLPFTIVFTKADKLSKKELSDNIAAYEKHLLESWEELPQMIISSAKTGLGKDEILDFIEETNEIYK
ncbi:MAG: ribosome biogenesis GTP-binding protein YihA/YsxC [Saprospiraceae bacterium]|nr:ribosome biogenesis GTP-binding protein YihA/YsxC [Saprospiraceae bacterium]